MSSINGIAASSAHNYVAQRQAASAAKPARTPETAPATKPERAPDASPAAKAASASQPTQSAVAAAQQEATESASVTRQEAQKGDPVAIRKLSRQAAQLAQSAQRNSAPAADHAISHETASPSVYSNNGRLDAHA